MLLQFSFQDVTQLLKMLVVQTAISHQLNALKQKTNIHQSNQKLEDMPTGNMSRKIKESYLGKRVHDLRQDVRVWLSADGLDERVTHEVPHLGEVLRSSDPCTFQQQGHGLSCCHPHAWDS